MSIRNLKTAKNQGSQSSSFERHVNIAALALTFLIIRLSTYVILRKFISTKFRDHVTFRSTVAKNLCLSFVRLRKFDFRLLGLEMVPQ